MAENVKRVPVKFVRNGANGRETRLLILDLQDRTLHFLPENVDFDSVSICNDVLVIRTDFTSKLFKLPNGPFYEEHSDEVCQLFDLKGICHLLEMKDTNPELLEDEEEWTIRNVKYCGETPRAVVRKCDEKNARSYPEIVSDSFASLIVDKEHNSLSLSVIPFPTGCETTKETRKLILDNLNGASLNDFKLYVSESKAIIEITEVDPIRFILLDFNI